jgi:hypothetical protein
MLFRVRWRRIIISAAGKRIRQPKPPLGIRVPREQEFFASSIRVVNMHAAAQLRTHPNCNSTVSCLTTWITAPDDSTASNGSRNAAF